MRFLPTLIVVAAFTAVITDARSADPVYRCDKLYQDHPCTPSARPVDIAPATKGLDIRTAVGKDVSSIEVKNHKNMVKSNEQQHLQTNAMLCKNLYGQEPSQVNGSCPARDDALKSYGPAKPTYNPPVGTISRTK